MYTPPSIANAVCLCIYTPIHTLSVCAHAHGAVSGVRFPPSTQTTNAL